MIAISVNDINSILTNIYKNIINIINLNLFLNIIFYYLIIYIIIFTISLIFLFRKENIKWYFALIPLYNIYIFMKIIDMKWYFAFIPFLNIIILFYANYNFARTYGRKKIICYLTMFFPIIFVPIISINKNITKHHRIKNKGFLLNKKDVDKLEDRLEGINQNETIYDINIPFLFNKKSNYTSKIDEKINTIENNAIKNNYDELLYQNELEMENKEIKKDIEKLETLQTDDIVDIFESNDIRKTGVNEKINQIENNNIKVKDTSDYKEYDKGTLSDSMIAFGGIEKIEKHEINVTEAKEEYQKCPYCKSQLIEGNGTCPGCGRDVSSLVFIKK